MKIGLVLLLSVLNGVVGGFLSFFMSAKLA